MFLLDWNTFFMLPLVEPLVCLLKRKARALYSFMVIGGDLSDDMFGVNAVRLRSAFLAASGLRIKPPTYSFSLLAFGDKLFIFNLRLFGA